tara:strand:+ start:469 stop:984 length:516 start_codon:yes stop_codon:yes gene_type:complete
MDDHDDPNVRPTILEACFLTDMDLDEARSITTDVWQARLREAVSFAAECERQRSEGHVDRAELARVRAERDRLTETVKGFQKMYVPCGDLLRDAGVRAITIEGSIRALVEERDRLRAAGDALADAVPVHTGQASVDGVHKVRGLHEAWRAVCAWRKELDRLLAEPAPEAKR